MTRLARIGIVIDVAIVLIDAILVAVLLVGGATLRDLALGAPFVAENLVAPASVGLLVGLIIGLLHVKHRAGVRRLAESRGQMAAMQEGLESILESLDAFVYVSDMRTHEVIYANPLLRERLGDVVGRKCWATLQKDQTGPCDFCPNPRLVDAAGKPAETIVWDHYNERMERWLRCMDRAIPWPDGRIVRLEVALDITEQKRVERRLRESEQRFRALFENTPRIAVQGYDRDRRVIFWNRASEDLYGYRSAEASGRRLEDLIIPPSMRESVVELTEAWIRDGTPIEPAEQVLLGKSGRGVHVYSSHVMLDNLDGDPELYCIDVDLAPLKTAMRELERTDDDLRRFVHIASHDLREPLRTIGSFLQVLERKYGDCLDDDARAYIGFAVDGAKRLDQLIQDLLQFSQVDVRPERLAPIDPAAVMAEVVEDFRPAIERMAAEVEVGPLPPVHADRSQVQILFQNLLSNALKYRADDRPPRVRVSAQRDGHLIAFTMTDNGIGIEPRYRERIFVIFQRLHPPEVYGGTGIGLAICKRIVERHEGRIWVEGTPGEGSAFRFTLPAADE